MLGLMIRKLAWWQGSDRGHVGRLKRIHLSDGYPYVAKTRDAWQLVHPVLTPRTAQRPTRRTAPPGARSALTAERRWGRNAYARCLTGLSRRVARLRSTPD